MLTSQLLQIVPSLLCFEFLLSKAHRPATAFLQSESCPHSGIPNKGQADPQLHSVHSYLRQISKAPRSEESDKEREESFASRPSAVSFYPRTLPQIPSLSPHSASLRNLPNLFQDSLGHQTLVPHWLERHKRGFQPADSDRWLCRGAQWRLLPVIPLQLTFQRKAQSRGSDLREADLINPAKGRAASSLHWLAAFSEHCRDNPLKCYLRKHQEVTFGRSQKVGERLKQECVINRRTFTTRS